MWNKKGFIYFVEIALSVLLLSFILSAFSYPKDLTFEQKQLVSLKYQGWGALDVLHEFDLLDNLIMNSDFKNLSLYLKGSFPDNIGYKLEYHNSTGCYPITDGGLGAPATYCGPQNATTERDITSTFYTIQTNLTTSSVRIYLWNKV